MHRYGEAFFPPIDAFLYSRTSTQLFQVLLATGYKRCNDIQSYLLPYVRVTSTLLFHFIMFLLYQWNHSSLSWGLEERRNWLLHSLLRLAFRDYPSFRYIYLWFWLNCSELISDFFSVSIRDDPQRNYITKSKMLMANCQKLVHRNMIRGKEVLS